MKNFIIKCITVVSLLLITTIQGEALTKAPSNVILEGNANGLVSIPEDTFLEYLNMLPGDKENGIINIKNAYDKSFELYLRAERVSEKQDYDLLDKIQLKVTYKDNILYQGPVNGEQPEVGTSMANNIYLGTFDPSDTRSITAEIELDGPSTTNEYRGKFAQVDWIFTAIATQDENIESDVDGDSNSSDKNPQPPKTGDTGIVLYIAMALGGGTLLTIANKKK